MPVSKALNNARDIVGYAHIHPAAKVAKARALCAAADAKDEETREAYQDESQAVLDSIPGARDDRRFTRSYIETALWTGVEYKHGDIRSDSDKETSFNPVDIAPDTLREMVADCAAFLEKGRALIDAAEDTGEVHTSEDGDVWTRAGHDFWLNRNGHGAGFWDGDWPEPFADQLDKLAKGFGEYDLAMDDDGSVGRM